MRAALVLLSLLVVTEAGAASLPAGFTPQRRDLGELIVLEVGGDYEEIGRQQAELLGDDLRRVYQLQLGEHRQAVERGGFADRMLDAIAIPLWSGVGGAFEDSHFHEELSGMADGLGVARRDLMRALLSLGGGSTVFAATRSATADGRALIGRNVDWDDALGARKPVIVHVHPSGPELEHVYAGWPLVGLPTVGVNEAGFALSFNYFETDPQVGMWMPQWPHRRALQVARTVEEGIRIFVEARERGISTFMVMADANGDLAMVECTPARCAVFRPEGDWFGQANHARTAEMIPFDLYRSPDSFDRRKAMEDAVTRHLGTLTPAIAAEILRDRSLHPWPNASNVANLAVLNAAVVHPASRTLWHSTTMQPFAPFGAYAGFRIGAGADAVSEIAASPLLAGETMARERAAIERGRLALHALAERRGADAQAGFDGLLAMSPPVLDPTRLAMGSAYARYLQGDDAGVLSSLAPAMAEGTDIEVRIYATSLAALCTDRLGRRDEAIALQRQTLALIDSHPEWNLFTKVAALAREGIAGPVGDREPVHWYYVLRIPF